jgi:hypothetical protein
VCPLPGDELALSQAQRSCKLARIGHKVCEEAFARVEDVRGAEVLCVSGCVGVACEAARFVLFAPKIVRKVGRVVGCDGLPSRRGVK